MMVSVCDCGEGLVLDGDRCLTCAHEARSLARRARYLLMDRLKHKRRATRRIALTIIRIDSVICGVCFRALTREQHPHPMSTTIGHEPPIAVAAREGWLTVVERPEHLRCNLLKGSLTDDDFARTVV